MSIRVGIAEDHPVVREGLEAALATAGEIEVAGTAATVEAARAMLGRDDVDVVILDIRLSDGNALQMLQREGHPFRAAVLVLSSFESSQYVAAAVLLGAQGFLVKTAPIEDLLDAVRRIARGDAVFTARQLRMGQRALVTLSRREREILVLLMTGRSNNEIAREIRAAPKTVEAHLARMFRRYGVASRTELALAAERGNWLDVLNSD